MGRPYVNVTSENIVDELKKRALHVLPEIQNLPGVVGITLNGGLARGYGDCLSEIDLTIFLTAPVYARWQRGLAPITVGICKIQDQLFDLKIAEIEVEESRPWGSVELWDLSYAKILYDPNGAIDALKDSKLSQKPTPADAGARLFAAWWSYRLAGDIWLYRGDPLQGHFILGDAVRSLVEALFLINREYVPHAKWLIHLSRTLERQPTNWPQWLTALCATGDLSLRSLEQRQRSIHDLWMLLDAWVREAVPSPVPAMTHFMYTLMERLVQSGSMSVVEWEQHASLSLLNMDPFKKVTVVDEQWVRFAPAKLAAIRPEDMYAWHYQIVEAIAAQPSPAGRRSNDVPD